MILNQLKSTAALYFKNIRGWRTSRKIVVIESDDWGSIRMPSWEVYERCLRSGYRVDNNPYERFDSLASNDDLTYLFEVLRSVTDSKGKHPVITANVLTANPDFQKIKESGYQEYHFELITETFKNYPCHHNSFQIWKEGMSERLFYPQSHGREHLNVSLFMKSLKKKDPDAHFGFLNNMPGIIPKDDLNGKNRYVEATNFSSLIDKQEKLNIVIEGLDIFYKLFGYVSETYIPTNYRWSPDFDESISSKGVRFYQGNYKMIEPLPGGAYKINQYKLGQKNKWQQGYLLRNAVFEPSLINGNPENSISNCLKNISIAFLLKKPATISSHRVNFVGFIDSGNRDRNLVYFKKLLYEIVSRWPEVEFMTSSELGNLISRTS